MGPLAILFYLGHTWEPKGIPRVIHCIGVYDLLMRALLIIYDLLLLTTTYDFILLLYDLLFTFAFRYGPMGFNIAHSRTHGAGAV